MVIRTILQTFIECLIYMYYAVFKSTLHGLFRLILKTILLGRYYYYSPLTVATIEVQRE